MAPDLTGVPELRARVDELREQELEARRHLRGIQSNRGRAVAALNRAIVELGGAPAPAGEPKVRPALAEGDLRPHCDVCGVTRTVSPDRNEQGETIGFLCWSHRSHVAQARKRGSSGNAAICEYLGFDE